MKLLLDTHVWIFAELQPERLSQGARAAMLHDGSQHFLSPISAWEAVLLAQRGRLELDPDPFSWVRSALERTPATMAPLTHAIALLSRELPEALGADPADRFLVATCMVDGLQLVTADRRLRDHAPIATIW